MVRFCKVDFVSAQIFFARAEAHATVVLHFQFRD